MSGVTIWITAEQQPITLSAKISESNVLINPLKDLNDKVGTEFIFDNKGILIDTIKPTLKSVNEVNYRPATW